MNFFDFFDFEGPRILQGGDVTEPNGEQIPTIS